MQLEIQGDVGRLRFRDEEPELQILALFQDAHLTFRLNGRDVLRISEDGELSFCEGASPTDAAKAIHAAWRHMVERMGG